MLIWEVNHKTYFYWFIIAMAVADPISRNSCVIYYRVVVYHYSFRWQKDICIHVWLCNMLSQEVNILGKRERERKEERERERERERESE